MSLAPRWMAIVPCLLLAACGGSGGPDAGGDASFRGTYFYAALGGARLEVPPFSHIDAGTLLADGAGGATATAVLANEDGVLGSLGGPLPLTYSVGPGFSMTLSDTGGELMRGGIATAGDVALGADLVANDYPLLMVMVKSVGAFGNASLQGAYHLLGVKVESSGAQTSVMTGASFDGMGGVTSLALPGFSNESGLVTPTPPFDPIGTYAVAADGRVTLDLGASVGRYTGAMVAGGSFVLLAGDTVAGTSPRLMLLVKVGAGLTNAAFHGSYWVAGISFDDATREHFSCGSGELEADGAGTFPSLSYTRNAEGTLGADTGTDDYEVAANGTLDVGDVHGAGPYQRGAVSSDGRFAVLSGAIVAGEPPVLYVLVRK